MKTYIMVDIEANGPIPGDYSMTSLGAVIVDEKLDNLFKMNLKPISEKFDPNRRQFIDETGACVISFHPKFPVWGWSGDRLVIESSGVVVDELPLLALIGCYILRSRGCAC